MVIWREWVKDICIVEGCQGHDEGTCNIIRVKERVVHVKGRGWGQGIG